MRRLVITAADSAFGMTVLKKLCEQGLDDFEWIFGTYYDAKDALDEVLDAYPELREKMKLRKVDMKDMDEIEAFKEELKGLETATDFVHLPASTFTVTRSPGFTVVTAEPTSSTTPTISWPTVMPGTARGTEPCLMCRSLVQIDPKVTRTTASRGLRISGLGLSMRANFPCSM